MLIVPLHCVDSCIFVFTSFDTAWQTVLVSVPGLPLPPLPPIFLCPRRNFGGILKSNRSSVRLSVSPSVRYKSCLSDISQTTEANLMKLHRKIKHNEKVCRAHDLGSYAQGQGRNQVKGQNRVSAITQKLLKQI